MIWKTNIVLSSIILMNNNKSIILILFYLLAYENHYFRCLYRKNMYYKIICIYLVLILSRRGPGELFAVPIRKFIHRTELSG